MSQSLPVGDEQLSEREQRLVNRLFSDPTLFPAPMKTWLVSYLEASDMVLPISSVHGLSAELNKLSTPAFSRLPSGTVLLFAGPQAPEGAEFHPDAQVQAAAPPGLRFIVVS